MSQIKRKMLSILLAAAMMLGLMPAMGQVTYAADEYQVWVGGVQVTGDNKDDIPVISGTAKYDPDSQTLTLDGARVGSTMKSGADSYGIQSTYDLTINLIGENTVFGSLVDNDFTSCGIYGENKVTIIGTGSLTAAGGDSRYSNDRSIGIKAGTLEIKCGDITAQGGGSSLAGRCYGTYSIKKTTVTGGSLNAEGNVAGIYADYDVEIVGGSVKATATGEDSLGGIFARGKISISGGTVNATGHKYGIDASSSIDISGGEVTAKALASYESAAISSGYNITISGGTVTAQGGNSGIRALSDSITIENGTKKVLADGTTYAMWAYSFSISDGLMIKEPEGGTVRDVTVGKVIKDATDATAKHVLIVPKEATYPVWVQGIQVSDSNKDDVLGDGKVVFTPSSGSTPHTLTLNGAAITDATEYPAIKAEGTDLLITGSASISPTKDYYGIRVWDGALTIKDAQLTISSGSPNGDAVWGGKTFTIENSTVEITGFSAGICANEKLFISGSAVKANVGNCGLNVNDTLTIKDDISSVHVKTSDGFAAVIAGTIVLGDKLMIKIPEGGVIKTGKGELSSYQVVFESDGATQAKEVLIVPKETVTTYPVWVGGVQATEANKDDILGDGTAGFDPETNTLTLKGLAVGDGHHASGASIVSTGIDLTVKGNATLTGGGYGIYVIKTDEVGGDLTLNDATITYAVEEGSDCGIRADGDIAINGGKIDVSAAKSGIRAKNITVSESTVTVQGTETGFNGEGSITILSGNVDARSTGTGNNYYSAIAGSEVSITGGTVKANSRSGKAVYAYHGDVKLDSDVTAECESGSAVEARYGDCFFMRGTIYTKGTVDADNKIIIENGIVKVTADGNGSEAFSQGVSDSYSLGDQLMILKPEGGKVDDDKTSVFESDGTTLAKYVEIVHKDAEPTETPTPEVTETPTPEVTETPTPEVTETPTPEVTETPTPEVTETPTPEVTETPTPEVTETPTPEVTETPTPEVTETPTPGATETPAPTAAPGGTTDSGNNEGNGDSDEFAYIVVSGDSSTFAPGSTEPVVITVKRTKEDEKCFSHFDCVILNGKKLTKTEEYDAKAGSTIVTIYASVLEKLDAGTYPVTVKFDDGTAETFIKIAGANRENGSGGKKDSSGGRKDGNAVKKDTNDGKKNDANGGSRDSGQKGGEKSDGGKKDSGKQNVKPTSPTTAPAAYKDGGKAVTPAAANTAPAPAGKGSTAPATGDHSNAWLWAVLMLMALSGGVFIYRRKIVR